MDQFNFVRVIQSFPLQTVPVYEYNLYDCIYLLTEDEQLIDESRIFCGPCC